MAHSPAAFFSGFMALLKNYRNYLPLLLGGLVSIAVLALCARLLRKRRCVEARLPLFSSEQAMPAAAQPDVQREPAVAPPPPPPPVEVVERCVSIVAQGRCNCAGTVESNAWFFAIVRDVCLLEGMRAAEPQLVRSPYVVALFRRGLAPQGDMTGKLITALHKAGLCTLPCTPREDGGAAHIRSLLRRPDAESLQLLLPVFSSGGPLLGVGGSYGLGDFAAVY